MSETPFKNDPFAILAHIFKDLYPNIKYEAFLSQELKDETGEPCCGFTTFPDDGSDPQIVVSADIPVFGAVETFAHELAHVAVGVGHEHDEVWDAVFADLQKHFDEAMERISNIKS